MKNEQLKRLIKEEIKNILKEGFLDPKVIGKTGTGKRPGGASSFTNLDPGTGISKPNTANTGQEKITSGDFNLRITNFLKDLKSNQSNIMGAEKQNILDLFDLIVEKAKEGNLTQTMEDKIKKILMLKEPEA